MSPWNVQLGKRRDVSEGNKEAKEVIPMRKPTVALPQPASSIRAMTAAISDLDFMVSF